MKKVTIKDVAKTAGVSEATVSRVMSNNPLISTKTKEKVLKVIKELDYFPNSAAVSLTKSSSKIIGIVIEDQNENPLQNDFFTETLSSISHNALKRGYYTLYIHSKNNEEAFLNIEKLVKTNRIDGIVFLNLTKHNKNISYLDKISFPYVIIGTPENLDKGLWVDNDNVKACYDVTKTCLEKGLKKLAFLSGPTDLTVSIYRKKGYKKALKEYSLKSMINLSSKFSSSDSYVKVKNYLLNNELDAIITTDDILAIGSLKAIEELGKNTIVTGFNNSKLRKYLKYDFITVDIKYSKLAKESIKLLIDYIEEKKISQNHSIVDAKLIK